MVNCLKVVLSRELEVGSFVLMRSLLYIVYDLEMKLRLNELKILFTQGFAKRLPQIFSSSSRTHL